MLDNASIPASIADNRECGNPTDLQDMTRLL